MYIIQRQIYYRVITTSGGGGGGGIQSVQAGTNISIDDTDPLNPIINATAGGGVTSGSGTTVTGTAVDFGGSVTKDAILEPDTNGVHSFVVGLSNKFLQVYLQATAAIQLILSDGIKNITFGAFGSFFQASSNDSGTGNSASVTVDSASGGSIKNTVNTVDSLTIKETGLKLGGASTPSYEEGGFYYNTTTKTFELKNNENEVTLQIGQEHWVRVYNNSGSTISNRTPVYITGANAGIPTIAMARANSLTTMRAIGWTTHEIENNTTGYVTVQGLVNGADTSTFSVNDVVYVSSSLAGGITNVAPSYPNYVVRMGIVVSVNASTGIILATQPTYVTPTIGRRLFYKNNVSSTFTGATTEVVLGFVVVPAGTIFANDVMRIRATITKVGTAGAMTARIRVGTTLPTIGSAVPGGTTQIGMLTNSATGTFMVKEMDVVFKNALNSQVTLSTVANVPSDVVATSNTLSSLSLDFSVDQYIMVGVSMAVATDTTNLNSFLIEIISSGN